MREKVISNCHNAEVVLTDYGMAGKTWECKSCGLPCDVVRVKDTGKAGEKKNVEDCRWEEEQEDIV